MIESLRINEKFGGPLYDPDDIPRAINDIIDFLNTRISATDHNVIEYSNGLLADISISTVHKLLLDGGKVRKDD